MTSFGRPLDLLPRMKMRDETLQMARVVVSVAVPWLCLNRADLELLSIDERRQSSAYPRSEGRLAFLWGRALLRKLIATECGPSLAGAPVIQTPNHKPRLASAGVEFSISHARGWTAVALSRDCPVGVDVEPVLPSPGMNEIVTEFFPSIAADEFHSAARDERHRVFYRWWTRIEAALKAHGQGLDDSQTCFEGVRVESCEQVPGLALAVAAKTSRRLRVHWRIPPRCVSLGLSPAQLPVPLRSH